MPKGPGTYGSKVGRPKKKKKKKFNKMIKKMLEKIAVGDSQGQYSEGDSTGGE